jgi:uncharacterized protein
MTESLPQTIDEMQGQIERHPSLKKLYALVEAKFGKHVSGVDRGHDLFHFLRVAFWTLKISAELEAKVDGAEAIAAALLHDIVPVPKNSPLRSQASLLCAQEAARILPELGFQAPAVANIAEAVRCHSFSRGEKAVTPLAMALQDADRLEALGSIGIMRCISTGAQMGAEYFDAEDPWARARELDDHAYSIDHFFKKLLKLDATMNTEPGRREARLRIRIMKEFLISLGSELAQPLPPELI